MPTRNPSPPKRVTRSRAKATEEKTLPTKPTRATTVTAKAAPRVTKRKSPVEEDEDELIAREAAQTITISTRSDVEKAPMKRTASTAKKTTQSTAAKNSVTAKPAARSTRGRPKKAESVGEEEVIVLGDTSTNPAPPARSTRARSGSVLAVAKVDDAPAKKVTAKKRVTFKEDEGDKENAADHVGKEGKVKAAKPGTKQMESKVKIVRPTTLKSGVTAKGKRVEHPPPKSEPLSPKKNAQVTMPQDTTSHQASDLQTTTAGSAQESPIKSKFPAVNQGAGTPSAGERSKPPALAQADDAEESADELQTPTALFTSPAKRLGSAVMRSPSKPQLSPNKGAFDQSPRKLPTIFASTPNETTRTTISSVLSKPARRFPMSAPPKQSIHDLSGRATDNALFKSPAKRPASPLKDLKFGTGSKSSATESLMKAMTSSGVTGSPRKLQPSPMKTVTSAAFKNAQSPAASLKVHKMTAEEQAKLFEEELANAPQSFSPSKGSTYGPSPKHPVQGSKIPIRSPQSSRVGLPDGEEPCSPSNRLNKSPSRVTHPQTPATERKLVQPVHHEQDSEDELSIDIPAVSTPLTGNRQVKDLVKDAEATPMFNANTPEEGPMTVLAQRFGQWHATTPDARGFEERKVERSIFSAFGAANTQSNMAQSVERPEELPETESYFEEAMAIYEDNDVTMHENDDVPREESMLRQSQRSDASQEYGDENVMPIDPALSDMVVEAPGFCTPARVFNNGPRVLHTVSKVPLKPSAEYDDAPKPKLARRAHSLSQTLSPQAELDLGMLRQLNPLQDNTALEYSSSGRDAAGSTAGRVSKFTEMLDETVQLGSSPIPTTPGAKTSSWSAAATPARTPRRDLNTQLLAGAVVFVDVHTTEGADASGIFIELLTQMGAKCVKQWNWSLRGSLDGSSSAGNLEEGGGTAVGITHVVFKDGGKRTMEKVREAKGLVLCVGVGWVLDCEKENQWLDEADYAIDTSTIPRGGHRRRKSMEPKSLTNSIFSPSKATTTTNMNPMKEFLNLSSSPEGDVDRRVSFFIPSTSLEVSGYGTPAKQGREDCQEPHLTTPVPSAIYAESSFGSPTTPYFLHPEALVQKTCPPKQTQQLFFPISGRIEDEPDATIRQRLLMARRKSLQWAPKIASPLSRTHSYQ